MASAVAKRSDQRAVRSASWSVMNSDEELARILQMQEEREYQDHMTAKELQSQNDHRLAKLLSEHDGLYEGRMDVDEFSKTRQSTTNRFSSDSARPSTTSHDATVISIKDNVADFSESFEDATFDELAGVLERAQNEAEQLVEQQEVVDTRTRDEEISQMLQNDEQMNGILENESVLLESSHECGDSSFNPIVISPASAVNNSGPNLSSHGGESTESSPMSVGASTSDDWTDETGSTASPRTSSAGNNPSVPSVNVAWNVVDLAVNWVAGWFSGVQAPLHFNFSSGVAGTDGDAEEDDEEDEEEDDDDEGWDDDGDSERSDGDIDVDDDDDDDDDDDGTFDDEMDSDMDDSDDGNAVNVSIDFGDGLAGSGLMQEEIDILPTRTYQSRLPRQTTAPSAGDAGASANEHQCQSECQVCLGSFVDGEVLRTLPCCHHFHSNCIDLWIQRKPICPVCRVRIRDEIGY